MIETNALVDRWVAGWSDSRQMHGRRDGDGWLVEVAAETRSQEYVCARPSLPELHRLVAATTGPDVWLTLVGTLDAQSLDAVAALDPVTSDERMMTASILPAPVPAQVRIEERGRVAHARIEVGGANSPPADRQRCAQETSYSIVLRQPQSSVAAASVVLS